MAAVALVENSGAARLPENSPSGLRFLLLFKAGVTSERHPLRDWEQKKGAPPNQTNCNTERSAAMEEAKVRLALPVPGMPWTWIVPSGSLVSCLRCVGRFGKVNMFK